MALASAKSATPSYKFAVVVLLGLLLAVPLFSVYLLSADRESQSSAARSSIVEGWGEPQRLAGPFLVLPFSQLVQTRVTESGREFSRSEQQERELFIAPTSLAIDTAIAPELRRRSIYEAVVYTADVRQSGFFRLPDLAALNIDPATIRLNEAELRVGVSSAKGLGGSQPAVRVDGRPLPLIPGSSLSQSQSSGFSARLGVAPVSGAPIRFEIAYALRGHDALGVQPAAQDTRWRATSRWPHPSFVGGFLPVSRSVSDKGFAAEWRIGNLALNRPIVSIGEAAAGETDAVSVNLINPVNLYDEVNRATKYGFLFVGFTFVALLMFDLIGGAPVAGPAYLLVGAGLVLFFVLLLAFAEVIGFTPAYLIAAGAIVGLISAYCAAILRSWRAGGLIAGMLAALYAVLYVLLSLEAYALLIGSLLLFVALAAIMYLTRNIDWRAVGRRPQDEIAS
jgi:inner membrane protein